MNEVMKKLVYLSVIWIAIYLIFVFISPISDLAVPPEERHHGFFDEVPGGMLFFGIYFGPLWLVWFLSSLWRDLRHEKYGFDFKTALISRLTLPVVAVGYLFSVKLSDSENYIEGAMFFILIIGLIFYAVSGAYEQRRRYMKNKQNFNNLL